MHIAAPGLGPAHKNHAATATVGRVAVSIIGPAGGSLRIADGQGEEDYGQLVVTFDVPQSGLDQDETITMAVLGLQLSDVIQATDLVSECDAPPCLRHTCAR